MQLALVHLVQIIGEAASRVSDDLRQRHPEIPWRQVVGMRNRVVHGYFDANGRLPGWLAELGPVVGYREPPHHSKFNTVIEKHNVLLTGTPDGVFVRPDGSHIIVDYKTAKFTGTQDSLFPMYEAQLNAYALLGERSGFNPVAGLALIYMEPVSDEPIDAAGRCNELGFEIDFRQRVLWGLQRCGMSVMGLMPRKIFLKVFEIFRQLVG